MIERARREIARHDLFSFISRAQVIVQAADNDTNPIESYEDAVAKAMKVWQEALTSALEQRDDTHLHRLRIAGKRLRYQVELLAELGDAEAVPLVETLRELQDALGDWHDRAVFVACVANFIGQVDFLVDHPDICRALLNEIEKEKLSHQTGINQLLADAAKVPETWVRWKPLIEQPAAVAS